MAVHDINGLLAILARLIIDKGETARFIGATIATQVNTLNTAELLEELLEIVLRCGRRNIGHTDCRNLHNFVF